MRPTAVFLALFLAQPAAAETVMLGDRSYDIDLPANPRGAKLIVALHDRGGDPDQFASASSFGRAAVRAGYAVTFPAGTGWRGDGSGQAARIIGRAAGRHG